MFHATAKALRSAEDSRIEDGDNRFVAEVEDIQIVGDAAPELHHLNFVDTGIDRDTLQVLHAEYRWSESKLAQASERLAEAQEARRKDLVALACMRRELRGSFSAETAYVSGQVRLFDALLPTLRKRENELADLVAGGALTAPVLRELAAIRCDRKLYELALGQSAAQLARIGENEATLEFEVANEAYEIEITGSTMRELARLRTAAGKAKRRSIAESAAARELMTTLAVDTSYGEVSAIASFLAAEFEGDMRAHQRVERVRGQQIGLELSALPEAEAAWKTGLLHPVSWVKARRVTAS